jgi:hypothetical protein
MCIMGTPVCKTLILMHNIDVMHQKCNVVDSILSTCMAFVKKTKDNHKAMKDLAQLCLKPKGKKEVWLEI